MKTSLNLTPFALRSLAVLAAATALMSAANASIPGYQRTHLGTAPIASGAGTPVFNPDAAGIDRSGASSGR
jgi:hypothetical protein